MAVEDKVEEEGNEVNVVLVCNDFGLRGRGGGGCTAAWTGNTVVTVP